MTTLSHKSLTAGSLNEINLSMFAKMVMVISTRYACYRFEVDVLKKKKKNAIVFTFS